MALVLFSCKKYERGFTLMTENRIQLLHLLKQMRDKKKDVRLFSNLDKATLLKVNQYLTEAGIEFDHKKN
jgi:hypothetical protein